MNDMNSRRLASSRSKQVQLTDGFQRCLGHTNGTSIKFSLTVIGLVTTLPDTIVLSGEVGEGEVEERVKGNGEGRRGEGERERGVRGWMG